MLVCWRAAGRGAAYDVFGGFQMQRMDRMREGGFGSRKSRSVFVFWTASEERGSERRGGLRVLGDHFMIKLLHLCRQKFIPGGSLAVSSDCHPVFSGSPAASVGSNRMLPRGAARRLHHTRLEQQCMLNFRLLIEFLSSLSQTFDRLILIRSMPPK